VGVPAGAGGADWGVTGTSGLRVNNGPGGNPVTHTLFDRSQCAVKGFDDSDQAVEEQ
jgi:hypothetical protein